MIIGDIYHNSQDIFFRRPFGAVPTGTDIVFRLAVSKSIGQQFVVLRLWSGEEETLLRMKQSIIRDHTVAAARDPGAAAGRGDATDSKYNISHISDCASGHNNTAAGGAAAATAATDAVEAPENEYLIYQAQYDVGIKPRLIWYYFILENPAGEKRYYGNNPEMLGGRGVDTPEPPWSYQITVYDRSFHVPGWLRNGIIYQIFPDRFYQKRAAPLTQADVEKKRPDYILHTDWNEKPIYKQDPRTGEIMNNDFFGGNLGGIADKLPYLKDLGISIIYLNPIFEAYSNHRYDTGNYFKIDGLLGSNSDFASLCVQARKLGIRVILDGVFNHTGSDSMYFNKEGFYKSVGAYQSKDSKYYGWYKFEEYPDKYESWWGIETLPHIDESNPEFIRQIITGNDSVVKYWLRQGASGWRLDVVDELPGEFVKRLRRHIKKTDGDAVIIGEVWEDASNKVSYEERREYLLGFELDSVMNYVFKDALIAFMLGKTNAGRFDAEIGKIAENYPKECYYSLMNIIGGHDVERILTILSEPPDGLTRDQKAMHKPTLQKHRIGLKRLKLMSLIQMTFPGAPCVYYGDEAGMTGFEDPFNRGSYPWGDENTELMEWYRHIIALRNAFPALRTGDFTTLLAAESVYIYTREIKNGADAFGAPAQDGFALVAINRDREHSETLDIDLTGRDIPELFDALSIAAEYAAADNPDDAVIITPRPYQNYAGGRLRITLEPLGCLVLVAY